MKKGRWLILGIAILFSLSTVSAREIFSGWVVSEEPFTAGDMTFVARYVRETGRLIINTSTDRVLLSKGDCKEREDIQYCFLAVDFDEHARYEHGKEYAGINLLITLLEPTIQVEREFSTTAPKIMERVTIQGKVKNVGDTNANNLVYADSFPPWILVKYSTTPIVGNSVRMVVSYLAPGNERPFRYIIEPRDYKEFDSAATVSYDYVGGSTIIKTDPTYLEVASPVSIKENFSDHVAKVNEMVTYTITIQNKDLRTDLSVNEFAIQIPPGLDVLSFTPNLEKKGNALIFQNMVKKDSKETLTITLSSRQAGKYVVRTLADFTINNLPIKKELSQKLTVSSTDIVPVLEIEPMQAKEGDYYHITATLTNQGEEDIADVDTSISGIKELPLDFNNRAVLRRRTLELYDAELPVPEVNATTTKTIHLDGSYNDSRGRRFSFSTKEEITFLPGPKVLELRHEIPAFIRPGENITIIIYAKNLRLQPLSGIELATMLPKGTKVKEGDPYGSISLKANEEKEAYRFTLHVFPTYKKDEINIKTIGNAVYDSEFIKVTRQATIVIGEAPLQPPVLEEIQPSSEEQQPEVQQNISEIPLPQEEQGFFVRLFTLLKRLLFG
ncbi:hypothetical protein HY488_01975 [Candidatus Woesearchaeota archaeon]|nr:hypothetical protein [Candidatus Woesearchaeota archaeon]